MRQIFSFYILLADNVWGRRERNILGRAVLRAFSRRVIGRDKTRNDQDQKRKLWEGGSVCWCRYHCTRRPWTNFFEAQKKEWFTSWRSQVSKCYLPSVRKKEGIISKKSGDFFRAIFLFSHLFLVVLHLFLVIFDSGAVFSRLQSSDEIFFCWMRIELKFTIQNLSASFG